MTDPKPLETAAQELRTMVGQLNETVKTAHDVKDQLNDLVRRSKINRMMITALIAVLVVNLAIASTMVYMGIRLNKVVQVQQDSALCPLYQLFIDADTPANRERAKLQGQDVNERNKAFVVIRNSYRALDCK